MGPSLGWQGKLARVDRFTQRTPDDGQPATQRTDVYLGYDNRYLYAIFVAFDKEPARIRARLDRREAIPSDEDGVGIWLDTFHDQRRAYFFYCNPLGIQWDAVESEDGAEDTSFDTVWDSSGRVTTQGYIVWMSIPFKSLRFSPNPSQVWGIFVYRYLPRNSEDMFWPPMSKKRQGRLNQAGSANGMEGISPGRNLQFIPYFTGRSLRAVDFRDPAQPVYTAKTIEANVGLDSKIIFKDSLVLDLTVNPDFNQVESDEPQSVVNERYEVFFPEKRPFFIENAGYFDVPMSGSDNRLLFTRRIADPELGARLTGKVGKYSVGALVADDQAPGKRVPPGDPLEGKRAYFDVLRLSRDLPGQSNIGAIYTERRFAGSYNRVFALDGTFRLNKTWSAALLGGNSWNRDLTGFTTSGSDVEARLQRQSRSFNYDFQFADRSPDFHTEAGYVRRNDVRFVSQRVSYTFWPKSDWLSNIKPELYLDKGWDHHGTGIFATLNTSLSVQLRQPTSLTFSYWKWNDVLRPKDYPVLTRNRSYSEQAFGGIVSTSYWRYASLRAEVWWGPQLNYVPAAGTAPEVADHITGSFGVSLRPFGRLAIDNTYLLDHYVSRSDGRAIFNSHVIRSKWNWQLSRELSLRFIGQYNGLLANPALTSASPNRNFNADILLTYLVHPGTAIYLGYNSNLRRPGPPVGGLGPDRFVNDGRQVFVKVSYLFRF